MTKRSLIITLSFSLFISVLPAFAKAESIGESYGAAGSPAETVANQNRGRSYNRSKQTRGKRAAWYRVRRNKGLHRGWYIGRGNPHRTRARLVRQYYYVNGRRLVRWVRVM